MSQKEHQRRVLVRFLDSLNGTWRRRAACNPSTGVVPADRIPQFFTADDEEELSLNQQREIALFCNTACPVQQECLAFAIDSRDGNWVWGGTTETERRLLMRRERTLRRKSA